MKPVLGLIPARAGSKEIPGKNLRHLAGRPLMAYTVQSAVESGVIDRLVLSTDSPAIAEVGRTLGVETPFVRPAELATDEASMAAVVEHAVRELGIGGWWAATVVLLQPTAPLRAPSDIVRALEMLEKTGCDSVVSVVEVPHRYAPHYVMEIRDGRLVNFLAEGDDIVRRQDAPRAYFRDGNVYAVRTSVLLESHSLYGEDCRPLVLSGEREANLDTVMDWEAAELLLLGSVLSQQQDLT